MTLLILPSCLRVSTPKSASASAGPDIYLLAHSTVNIPLSACFPSIPLHLRCPICLSSLCLLVVVIILCFLPGEILGANYRFYIDDARCLRHLPRVYDPKWSRTRSPAHCYSGPNKPYTISHFEVMISDLRRSSRSSFWAYPLPRNEWP